MGNLARKTFKTAGSDQGSIELMRAMGSKKGFDPIPPDQHAWQMAEGESPLYRIWSYLCSKTIRHGHRSAFAVDTEGKEIRGERIGADLNMDEANVRFALRQGIARGLWRFGTKQEGPRRIYLCGEVKPTGAVPEGEDKEKEKVCANLLPPYILKQIKDWTSDKRKRFLAEEKAERELENLIRADLDAARRLLITQRQDTRYEAYGVKKIREEHPPKKVAPESVARDQRVQVLLPLLSPTLKRFAQTFSETVCANSNSGCAQTPVSLLLYSEVTENPYTEKTHPAGGRAFSGIGTSPEAQNQAPARPPEGPSLLETELRQYLTAEQKRLGIPSILDEPMFQEIAAAIPDRQHFDAFQKSLQGRRAQKWALVRTIAREAVPAPVNGHKPSTELPAEYLRLMKERGVSNA